jgi:hypothetical protein
MAVVQISKIQVRRGKKNQSTGMPQLASGELAWAIDTQELYIGNGAVSEGAPYVGNTKILTEKDSLLSIAAQYQYKFDSITGNSAPSTVLRTLQSRLDDGVVNARNFGIVPSSELSLDQLDQTDKIQDAIDSISSTTNVTLEFEPGEYEFSETIILPSNISISGFGKNKTFFKFTGTGIAFDTDELSEGQHLSNFSILLTNNNSSCIRINNSKYLNFKNLKLEYSIGPNDPGTLLNERIGLLILGNNFISNNKFSGIEFKKLTYGVYGETSPSYNKFEDCLFELLYQGVVLGVNSSAGSNYNTVTNSVFDDITREAIVVINGEGNTSRGNKFRYVGGFNLDDGEFTSSYSVIRFDTDGNTSIDDIFQRQQRLESNDLLYILNPYVPELQGSGLLPVSAPRKISLPIGENRTAFRLPLNSATSIKIDYIFSSPGQVRKGTMNLIVNSLNDRVNLVDDYEYTGTDVNGENLLIFTASIGYTNGGATKHIEIIYTNINISAATFTYTYSILS